MLYREVKEMLERENAFSKTEDKNQPQFGSENNLYSEVSLKRPKTAVHIKRSLVGSHEAQNLPFIYRSPGI